MKMVLFKGNIETQGYFSIQLANYFERMGHKVFMYDFLNEDKSFADLVWFCDSDTVMITFNYTALGHEKWFYREDEPSFWDERNVLCINIVVDHPFYYDDFIYLLPKRYHQISIDRFHKTYLERFYPEAGRSTFLPLGGTELPGTKQGSSERPIDVVFTGHYVPPEHFEPHFAQKGKEYEVFYKDIAEDLIQCPSQTMEEVFERHIIREMGETDERLLRLCMKNMIFIDLYVRFYMRGLAVKNLVDSGIKVHTFGSGWDKLRCRHPENLIQGGSVNSLQCLEEISRAKISLNVMPWFKDGAHDRIFNSVLNGALCVTDSSIYLREIFTDKKDMVFYNLHSIQKLPDMVAYYLENEAEREQIITAGYHKIKAEHTWGSRGEELLKTIEKHL